MSLENYDVIILAGGLGTRLRSVVPDLPKPMAPVAGKPFLAHLLNQLSKESVKRVILSVGYKANLISQHFGKNFEQIELIYAQEESALGTGGAIAYSLKKTKSDYALVLNGDTFLKMDYADFIHSCIEFNSPLGVAIRYVPDTTRYGRCELTNKRLTSFNEKTSCRPGWINGGVYCIKKDLFTNNPAHENFSFEQDFISNNLDKIKIFGYETEGYFIDIGIPSDYQQAQSDFLSI
ncbi:nucleotidyltransferase family protein [Ampullimonas aquatilis]|uniref:nucleotidyltransferase family protein n=1 Tax=Ampullimonas aquatilis TaxID=1341549 RepID=UPI003C74F004